MIGSSRSPPNAGFTRATLLILILAVTGWLIPSTEGLNCFECQSTEEDHPKCPVGSAMKECGPSVEGCFAINATDAGKKETGFGGCFDQTKFECVIRATGQRGSDDVKYHDYLMKNWCLKISMESDTSFNLVNECLGRNDFQKPSAETEVLVDFCSCDGDFCNGEKSLYFGGGHSPSGTGGREANPEKGGASGMTIGLFGETGFSAGAGVVIWAWNLST